MIAIRLLADGGTVVREAVFAGDREVVLGRGSDCDFMVVDPSVSRQHARVRRDEAGELWVEDAGSRNGLVVGGTRVDRMAVPRGGVLRFRLGAVELELAVSSTEVTLELARPIPPARPAARALRALAYWAAGMAAWVAMVVSEPDFWSPWEKERATGLSFAVLGSAVALPIVAFMLVGLWRVAGRRVRLADALRAICLVSWAGALVHGASLAGAYVLGVAAHSAVDNALSNAVVVVGLAYLASVGRPGRRRRFFLTWVAATGLLMLASEAVGRLAARQLGTPSLDYDVEVPLYGVTGPASDLDGYLERVRVDFQGASQRADEERKLLEAAR